MPTSARRLGLDVLDLELELRLRRIETELENRVRTTDLSDGDTIRTTDIPTVTGLRVSGSTAGAITIAWTAVPISDLKRYEIDIAEDLGFSTNLVTSFVAGTEFNYTTNSDTGGGGGTDVFVRVRARAQSGNVGLYSVTLNATTGQAQVNDIADDAVTTDAIADGAITSDKVDSDDPIKFTGLDDADVGAKLALANDIDGLTLSNNGDDSIDVGVGIARDSTGVMSMALTSAITGKDLSVAWAIGNGGGGLASAVTYSTDSPYFAFLLSNSTGTILDLGFDSDPTGVNLLLDTGALSFFRRIGCVVTDASPNIRGFTQLGDYFSLNEPKQTIKVTDPGTGVRTHTLNHLPIGVPHIAHLSINWRPTDAQNWTGYVQYGPLTATFTGVPSSGDNDGGVQGDGRILSHSPSIYVGVEGQIKTRQSASSGSTVVLSIQIHGWTDIRGKDGTA